MMIPKRDPILNRWWRYKWSGLITFAPIIILSIGLYLYMNDQQEFYSAWSCETINGYLLGIDVPDKYPLHGTLTTEQHLKLHAIHQECVDDIPFSINQHK